MLRKRPYVLGVCCAPKIGNARLNLGLAVTTATRADVLPEVPRVGHCRAPVGTKAVGASRSRRDAEIQLFLSGWIRFPPARS
jgi:hypothetical protein